MGPLIILIVTIIVISAVVGLIAQFLNKLNEANAPARRPAGSRPDGGAARQSERDMDRFLAEIDRLRKRNHEGASQETAQKPPAPPQPTPVARPARMPDRAKARVVAELAEPKPEKSTRRKTDAQGFTTRVERREATDAQGFTAPHTAQVSPITTASLARDELPVAFVVTAASATGAPATRVTTLPQRDRPSPKTDLAANLTRLLNSGQGAAMAIILQEVLGPPRCKK